MTRRLIVLAVFLLAGSAPALAQSGKAAAPSPAEKQLIGKWAGTFTSDHTNGRMQLLVARDSVWKVTQSLHTDLHPIPDVQLAEFKPEGNKITWTQELMGGTCRSSAVLEKNELKGETSCEQVNLTFVLRKS